MSDAPLKSKVLSGNIRRANLSSEICEQSTNISTGLWNICVASICLDTKDQNGLFCAVSCNLVKDKKLNANTKVLETYNPVIATVFLKGRKIVYLDKTWFTINNQCTEIKLFFSNIQTNEQIIIDCDLHVTVLFQRIK
jgi:hypothetical protein